MAIPAGRRIRHFPVALLLAGILRIAVSSAASFESPTTDEARAALRRGEPDSAIAILKGVIEREPADARAHFVLGSAYGLKAQEGGMLGAVRYGRKVRDQYEQAVALDPADLDARYALLVFYGLAPGMVGGSLDKAAEQARAIERIDPVVGHRAAAFLYERQKKMDLARKEYVDAIRDHPSSSRAHNYYGQYLMTVEHDPAAALDEFESAVNAESPYMPAYYNLGRTAALAGTNLERGEAALKKYLSYTPGVIEPTHASAHYYLGIIYEKQGRTSEAKTNYESAFRLNPGLKDLKEALKRVS